MNMIAQRETDLFIFSYPQTTTDWIEYSPKLYIPHWVVVTFVTHKITVCEEAP